MLKRLVLLCWFVCLAVPLYAAEIYGQLWDTGNRAPKGAQVSSNCGAPTPVDDYGRYRLTGLPLRTSCSLQIEYRGKTSTPVNIYTANQRNSANFMLKQAGGRLLLIRR